MTLYNVRHVLLSTACVQNELIEDLCEPELEDDLFSLRKLNEVRVRHDPPSPSPPSPLPTLTPPLPHPSPQEQNHRHRRYAVSTTTRSTRPSLSHSNSREEMGREKQSPIIVRRRWVGSKWNCTHLYRDGVNCALLQDTYVHVNVPVHIVCACACM